MNIKDYKFNIGDTVITTEGEEGVIVDICKCDKCRSRKFYEPIWVSKSKDDNCENYITNYQAKYGFEEFYQIGKYHFNDFDKAEVLKQMNYYEGKANQLKNQLKLIKKLESKNTKQKKQKKP